MSQNLVNQITLDCLINKEIMENHIIKQREKQINKNELNFYRKRIINLFKELISNNLKDISPDVKYSYDCFINSSIRHFKVLDNNDLLQEEYKDMDHLLDKCIENISDKDIEIINKSDADKLLMRSVKMDVPTLDKYVKKTQHKKEENYLIPKLREIDITNPELKNKGIKKNINIIYEDNTQNKK